MALSGPGKKTHPLCPHVPELGLPGRERVHASGPGLAARL